jgi:hypothetical protein
MCALTSGTRYDGQTLNTRQVQNRAQMLCLPADRPVYSCLGHDSGECRHSRPHTHQEKEGTKWPLIRDTIDGLVANKWNYTQLRLPTWMHPVAGGNATYVK